MTRRWLALALLAAASFGGGRAAARYAGRRGDSERQREARILTRAVETIRRNYVDAIAPDSLYLKATDGLVHSLNDPYAELMLADAYRRFNQQMSGTRIQLGTAGGPARGGRRVGMGTRIHRGWPGDRTRR